MLPRLTRLARQRPALALVPLALTAALGGGLWHKYVASNTAVDPGLLVNRVWFDRLPEQPTQDFGRWAFLDAGYGFHGEGSAFRFNVDIVEFDRQGDKLKVTFLQDERVVSTRFKIDRCDDKPPFDACLTFDQSPGGPKKLYAFLDEGDEQARLPGATAWRRSLSGQAAAVRAFKKP